MTVFGAGAVAKQHRYCECCGTELWFFSMLSRFCLAFEASVWPELVAESKKGYWWHF